ncbi:Trafficking protein particle complex subunit 13, partial [Coemansia sp. RSA 2702]
MASLMRETHPLALKVMRLSRPALADTRPLPLDSSESVLAQPLRDIEQSQPAASGQVFSDLQLADPQHPLDAFPLSEALVLPRSFGTMFLGETFSAQMCISNDSAFVVRDVSVTAVMQTASQQQPQALAESAQAPGEGQQLAAGQPLSLQVSHEIKELGTHVLGCTIAYLSAQGERRTLQRSFRFQAANPLVVKTKVNHLARDVLLEVQVHNATHATLVLERLRFEAASPFAAEDLSPPALWGSPAGFMQAGDVRQYLYRLQPPAAASAASVEHERAVQYATALGKLDILWRGAFGSVGRLQTAQLLRKSPGMFLIEVDGAEVAGCVSVEAPFVARVRVRNVSERRMAV